MTTSTTGTTSTSSSQTDSLTSTYTSSTISTSTTSLTRTGTVSTSSTSLTRTGTFSTSSTSLTRTGTTTTTISMTVYESESEESDDPLVAANDSNDTSSNATTLTSTALTSTTASVTKPSFEVIFDGDYDGVVGDNKSGFLAECSAYFLDSDVTCSDVRPGSIIVTLQCNACTASQVSELVEGGLHLPSFGSLFSASSITPPPPENSSDTAAEASTTIAVVIILVPLCVCCSCGIWWWRRRRQLSLQHGTKLEDENPKTDLGEDATLRTLAVLEALDTAEVPAVAEASLDDANAEVPADTAEIQLDVLPDILPDEILEEMPDSLPTTTTMRDFGDEFLETNIPRSDSAVTVIRADAMAIETIRTNAMPTS